MSCTDLFSIWARCNVPFSCLGSSNLLYRLFHYIIRAVADRKRFFYGPAWLIGIGRLRLRRFVLGFFADNNVSHSKLVQGISVFLPSICVFVLLMFACTAQAIDLVFGTPCSSSVWCSFKLMIRNGASAIGTRFMYIY